MDDKREAEEFDSFIKAWALKKMRRQEKKLKYFARLYYGKPMAIIYAQDGATIVHNDGTEEEVRA